jgi:hypothetical protein
MRVNLVRHFDGNAATYSYATGFVVDAARGLILSNRHVVTAGPITADAVFLNKEEVQVIPIYRSGGAAPGNLTATCRLCLQQPCDAGRVCMRAQRSYPRLRLVSIRSIDGEVYDAEGDPVSATGGTRRLRDTRHRGTGRG